MTLLLWKLIAAHLVTRFIFQPRLLAQAGAQPKNASKIGVLFLNSMLFLAVALLLVLPGFRYLPISLESLALLLGLMVLARVAIDVLSLFRLFGNWQGLLVIQAMHVSAITMVALLFGKAPGFFEHLSAAWTSPRTYGLIAMYSISLGLGSILVPLITGSFGIEEKPGLKDAGRYIGILERLVITTLVIYWPRLDASAIAVPGRSPPIRSVPFGSSWRYSDQAVVVTADKMSRRPLLVIIEVEPPPQVVAYR